MTPDEQAAALTPEQRSEIEALAEAATPGPWWADSWEIYGGTEDTPRYDEDGDKVWIAESCAGGWGQDTANGKFIAAARTAVPALLAALADAEADRDRLRAAVERRSAMTLVQHRALRKRASAASDLERSQAYMRAAKRTDWDSNVILGWLDETRAALDETDTTAVSAPDYPTSIDPAVMDAAVEAAAKVLSDEGGEPGSDLHSWTCEYPEQYGPCDCLAVTARLILAAAAPIILAACPECAAAQRAAEYSLEQLDSIHDACGGDDE